MPSIRLSKIQLLWPKKIFDAADADSPINRLPSKSAKCILESVGADDEISVSNQKSAVTPGSTVWEMMEPAENTV